MTPAHLEAVAWDHVQGSANFSTLGWPEDSGVFRIAMDYDTSSRA